MSGPEVRDLAEQIGKVRESQIEILTGGTSPGNPGRDVEGAEDENAQHHGGHGLMTKADAPPARPMLRSWSPWGELASYCLHALKAASDVGTATATARLVSIVFTGPTPA